jgi:hypothetical protein
MTVNIPISPESNEYSTCERENGKAEVESQGDWMRETDEADGQNKNRTMKD